MEKYQLDNQHYMFGGKGDVWSNTAHIAKSGEYTTMCGRPMLSSNWVAIEGVKHIGCPKCVDKYQQLEEAKCVMAQP